MRAPRAALAKPIIFRRNDVIDEMRQAALSQIGREEKAAAADKVSPIVGHRVSIAQRKVMGFNPSYGLSLIATIFGELNYFTDLVEVPLPLDRISVLALILGDTLEPIIWVLQSHSDKRLNHSLSQY